MDRRYFVYSACSCSPNKRLIMKLFYDDDLIIELGRKEKRNDYLRALGIEIKKRRSMANLTLKEVSDGICCISYLSKLENNLLEGKPYFVREVFQKLSPEDSNSCIIEAECFDKLLYALIKGFYYNDDKLLGCIRNYVQGKEMAYYLDIIRLILAVGNKNHSEADNAIRGIIIYKGALPKSDIILLSIFTAIHYYQTGEYLRCKRILDQARITTDPILIALINYYDFYSCFRLRQTSRFDEMFRTVCNDCILFSNDVLLAKLKNDYFFMLAYLGRINDAHLYYKRYKEIHSLPIMAFIELLRDNASKAKIMLETYQASDTFYYVICLNVYERINDRYNISRILSRIDWNEEIANDDYREYLLYNRVKYDSESTNDHIKRYLKDVVLVNKYVNGNAFALEYYVKELYDILVSEAHYKEATIVMDKYRDALRNINNALICR